jgi:hypothetical protein
LRGDGVERGEEPLEVDAKAPGRTRGAERDALGAYFQRFVVQRRRANETLEPREVHQFRVRFRGEARLGARGGEALERAPQPRRRRS